MKTIKFRAWDKEKLCFVPLETIFFTTESKTLIGKIPDTPRIELQQYTGLKDKNGKEIYEGDIFNCHYSDETKNHHKWEVIWSDEYASFKLKRIGNPCNQSMVSQNVYDYSGWNGEVIGNIYQNKELLK